MALVHGGVDVVARAEEETAVSVVIPTRNEARNIGWVLRRLPSCVSEVVLIDSSADATVEVARRARPDVVVVREDRRGKGAALRAGFRAATGDVVVMLDADGSMDPSEIQRFVDAVVEGHDVVKGSRFAPGGGSSDLTWFRSTGNRCLLALANSLYGVEFTELCYGYFAFSRRALQQLPLSSDGFEIETEIVLRSVLCELDVVEVPSLEARRRHGESHLHPIRDGLRVLNTLVRLRYEAARGSRTIDLREPAAIDPAVMELAMETSA